MKQAQSGTSSPLLANRGRWWSIGSDSPPPMDMGWRRSSAGLGGGGGQPAAWSWGRVVLAPFAAVWFIATLPFRLVFWIIALLGRIAGIVLGFSLMVGGMFFLAGPLFLIGIPLFIIGLVLTLRCLE
jgi:hypothetical protein